MAQDVRPAFRPPPGVRGFFETWSSTDRGSSSSPDAGLLAYRDRQAMDDASQVLTAIWPKVMSGVLVG